MALKKSQKSLKKWTKQKWDYISKIDKKKPKSKRGSKGGPANVWSARKAQMLAREYKAKGGGYKN